MTIKRETLEAAAAAGILKYRQIDNLLVFLIQEDLKKTRAPGSGRLHALLLVCLAGVLALGQFTGEWFQDSEALAWMLAAQSLAVLALGLWWWRSRQASAERLSRALRARYRMRGML